MLFPPTRNHYFRGKVWSNCNEKWKQNYIPGNIYNYQIHQSFDVDIYKTFVMYVQYGSMNEKGLTLSYLQCNSYVQEGDGIKHNFWLIYPADQSIPF